MGKEYVEWMKENGYEVQPEWMMNEMQEAHMNGFNQGVEFMKKGDYFVVDRKTIRNATEELNPCQYCPSNRGVRDCRSKCKAYNAWFALSKVKKVGG